MSRFDYVKYDAAAMKQQDEFKRLVVDVEKFIEGVLASPRAKALAITALEECYMWIGKAIRDDQISRNGMSELQDKCRADIAKRSGFNGA